MAATSEPVKVALDFGSSKVEELEAPFFGGQGFGEKGLGLRDVEGRI